jgi:hypothetical protein
MPSAPTSSRPELQRTSTWPPTIRVVTDGPNAHKPPVGTQSAASKAKPTPSYFEDDVEDHPEDHFLSPMYEYDDWADDSDDDGEEIEWDAGITDFALFDSDRRRAQEEHDSLPSKWKGFRSEQQAALERAVHRSRAQSAPETTRPPLPMDAVPGLTPDSSPNLKDDLDVESFHGQSSARPVVPSYLTITVTPPDDDDDADVEDSIESDEDLPLSFYINRANRRRQERRKLERPGLRSSRTLSGKVHVWQRPDWHIYKIGEDPDAERKAEICAAKNPCDGEAERGRR